MQKTMANEFIDLRKLLTDNASDLVHMYLEVNRGTGGEQGQSQADVCIHMFGDSGSTKTRWGRLECL